MTRRRCSIILIALAITLFYANSILALDPTVNALLPVPENVESITPKDAPALARPKMKWAPQDFAKDPSVVKFHDKYYLYFSIPPQPEEAGKRGWSVGVAESDDLTEWRFIERLPADDERLLKGFCAPCARVLNDKVYIFYQSYGGGSKDAVCMAVSEDGVHFTHNPKNPIYRPHGEWTNGRAIDAELVQFQGKFFLYAATRDPEGKIQKIVVGVSENTIDEIWDLGADAWRQAYDGSILEPILPWETQCIEAPTTIERDGKLYMFYAGGYNNNPQHVGVAVSEDGVAWTRLWLVPFITNGPEGQWNASESGHPGVFLNEDGQTWLFFQGNDTKGKNWFLSRVKIGWRAAENGFEVPYLEEE
ncbi:MAG: family 43 glycosylhydrolase [Thermoguttaceae bacterium]|nr:family 43 glycosylhydrolase [Thermoguttaceae bacterium]